MCMTFLRSYKPREIERNSQPVTNLQHDHFRDSRYVPEGAAPVEQLLENLR